MNSLTNFWMSLLESVTLFPYIFSVRISYTVICDHNIKDQILFHTLYDHTNLSDQTTVGEIFFGTNGPPRWEWYHGVSE